MKIAFDARMIDHPGIGRYIKNILEAMIGIATEKGYQFVLYGDPQKLAGFSNCETREYEAAIYSWNEFFHSPFEDKSLDLVHIPHFNVPFQKKRKLVVTIHDLIYIKFPKQLTLGKRLAGRVVIKNAIKKADAVIAVSENTKKDIIEKFPDSAKKIKVIYEAVAPIFKKLNDRDYLGRKRRDYGLPDDIILFVGSIRRHKNIERLLDAYKQLKRKGARHRLVLSGRCDAEEDDLLSKIRATDAIYLGEIPTEDLIAIYNLAALLVLPSLYEGFGLPVLEAMACGVPVAAASASSLPEVIGDAGVLFDPYNTQAIADSIFRVLKDETLRRTLIEKGLNRVKEFSWEKAAGQTLQLYKELVI